MVKNKWFFLLIFGICYAQNNKIINSESSLKNDSLKIKSLLKIGQKFEEKSNDSALYYYLKANNLAKNTRWIEGELSSISNITAIYNIEGQYNKSLQLNLYSVALAKKTNDYLWIGRCLANVGTTYIYLNNYQKAIEYNLKALKLFEKSNNKDFLARMYANIAIIYPRIEQYQKALLYIDKAILLNEKGFATDNYIASLNTKANILCYLKKYNEAMPLYLKGLETAKKQGDKYQLAVFSNNILDTYKLLGKYSKMISVAQNHFNYCKDYGTNEMYSSGYKGLAEAYFYNKKNQEAQVFADKSLHYALKDTILEEMKFIYELKSKISFSLGDLKNGNYFFDKAKSIDSQLVNDDIIKNTQELEAKYETEKKELKIKNLTHESEIQKYKSKQKLWIIFSLIIGIIGITIFTYLQYKNYQNKKKFILQEKQLSIAEERIRIANDMHDDVGAGLSRIRYISTILKNNEGIKNSEIEKIISLSDEAVEKMNEIIWALNQGNQKLDELIYYIRSQCSEMVHNASIEFICEPPTNIPNVIFGWKENRNTYLLAKEAVNNAIKHSKATIISIHFEISNDLKITISDNGIGYNPEKIRKGSNGLKNFNKRIETLEGSLNITNSTDNGVTVSFTIPIHNKFR